MSAARPNPATGILDRKISRWFLKKFTCSEFIPLRLEGNRLNNLAPLALRDHYSLAFLTADGAVRTTAFGIILLPLLPPSKENSIE